MSSVRGEGAFDGAQHEEYQMAVNTDLSLNLGLLRNYRNLRPAPMCQADRHQHRAWANRSFR